jgi:hypothetical protein
MGEAEGLLREEQKWPIVGTFIGLSDILIAFEDM